MGFTQAMAAGYEMGSRWKNRDREEQIRKGIEEAAKLDVVKTGLDNSEVTATEQRVNPETGEAYTGLTVKPEAVGVRADAKYAVGAKSFDTAPSESQVDRARMAAMSGVYAKNGDPARAIELRSMARRGEMEDMQLEGAKREEAYRLGIPELQKGSRFAQVQADGGKYSPMDSMADTANFLAYGAKHGKYDIAGWQGLAEKTQKLEAEGFHKALNLADAGGTLDEIAKVYNATGADKFDPKSVISDTKGEALLRGEKVATRIITYKDAAGNVRTINTAADLAGLGQTRELLATHFAAKADQRGDKSLSNESARVGIAQKDSNRLADKDAREQKTTNETRAALVASFKETNPNATPAQIEVVRLGLTPKDRPNDIKATNGLTQLQARYGGRLEGGMWFPEKENKDVAIKANSAYERNINKGMQPMAAAEAAINEAERDSALKPGAKTATSGTKKDFSAIYQ